MRSPIKILGLSLLAALQLSCGGNTKQTEQAAEDVATWKTGVALYSFNKFPFPQTLHKADSAGLKMVEGFSFHQLGAEFGNRNIAQLTDEDIQKVKELLSSRNMEMPSVYVGDAKTPEDWVRYFELGKKLDLKFFVTEPQPNEWDLLDSLGNVYGIKTAIHQHAQGESYYWHPDSVLKAAANRPNIGACADVGHWTRSGLDPVESLKALEGKIISIHLKDVKTKNDPKTSYEVIGTGVIDFKGIANELKRQKFSGNVYIEQEANWFHNVPDVMAGLAFFQNAISNKNPETTMNTNDHPPLEGIKHMVIFDLKHAKGSAEAAQFLKDGHRLLSAIPSVQNFQAYEQVSPKNDFSYGFSMVFKDTDGYEAYNNHPDHVDFVENRWKPEVTRFLEIDFENFD